ncbi:MAG: metallophosphoesterase [Chitinivibrionales bacterium]|nr:metallophosphoesterase [Chitinivibrionales bacterium]
MKKYRPLIILVFFPAWFFYSWKIEPNTLHIRNIPLSAPKIKKDCCLVLMADLHIPLSAAVEKSLQWQLGRIKPDIILIAGDFTSYRASAASAFLLLKKMSAYSKIFMVRGNTDLCCNQRQCLYCTYRYPQDRLDQLPATILMNQTKYLPEFNIALFGEDDPVTQNDNPGLIDSAQASRFNICLLHSNYKLVKRPVGNLDLICSGHSHGGQIFFLKPLASFFDRAVDRRFLAGLYAYQGKPMIVTSGIGMSFLPLRCGVAPEIVAVRLKRK